MKGIYFTTLNSQFNTHVVVDHNVPYTKSNQFFKGILSDESKAVFSGKIYVERNAQKSYAEQKDLNLIMSKGAQQERDEKLSYLTSCIFEVRSVPSALYKALGGFATNGVNLTKLESFIVDGDFNKAKFYIDLDGHDTD